MAGALLTALRVISVSLGAVCGFVLALELARAYRRRELRRMVMEEV